MGQLMNIVGPLLLLGGAIFVVSKRCELLGLCGETGGDSGVFPEASATEEVPTEEETTSPVSDTPPSGNAKKSGCCTCQMQGDRVKCHRGDAQWFNPPAGPDGSNDQSVELSLKECNKGCGGSSINKGQGSTTGAGARASGSASIPSKPRLNASGSVGSGAGAGGTRRTSSSSSSKPRSSGSSSLGGGARVNAGASFYAYYPYPRPMYRSYFVDPNYVRPFNLYHRIAN
jgi:hypothetical protein